MSFDLWRVAVPRSLPLHSFLAERFYGGYYVNRDCSQRILHMYSLQAFQFKLSYHKKNRNSSIRLQSSTEILYPYSVRQQRICRRLHSRVILNQAELIGLAGNLRQLASRIRTPRPRICVARAARLVGKSGVIEVVDQLSRAAWVLGEADEIVFLDLRLRAKCKHIRVCAHQLRKEEHVPDKN
eukprot:4635219-Pleurochrysis_carterae.AAC.2